eukprot:m.238340 g.238340  ORF g.238340 m.238340 type:complete len:77 (+) comp19388_c0_seq7:1468-1698(+)
MPSFFPRGGVEMPTDSDGTLQVRTLTRTLRVQQDAGLQSAISREADCQGHNYASPDMLEGLAAIREKRKPRFSARL